jgi:Effector Associated Constant Component 1
LAQNEVELAVVGDEHVLETRSLLAALRADDLRGVRPELRRGDADPESLGLVDEVVGMVVNPEVGAALAGALGTWLTTRRRTVRLRIKRPGEELELEAGSPRDAEKIVKQIKDFLDEE